MDDASYAVLARSITSSDAYGLINAPGQPQPTRYPFGFPLLLTPVTVAFPDSLDHLKVVSLLATVINSALLFFGWPYLSRNKSYWAGLAITTLYALSPLVVGHTRMVMSEPVFTTFVLLSLILVEKFLVAEEAMRLPALMAGVATSFALFIRTIGLVLVAAVIIRILLLSIDRYSKVRRLFWLCLGGIFFVTIIVTATPVTIESLIPDIYTDQLNTPRAWGQSSNDDPVIQRLISAPRDYIGYHLREALIPIGGGDNELAFGKSLGIPNLPLITGVVIGSLVALGIFSVFKGQGFLPSVLIFEVLYIGLIFLWPFRSARFLYPILPFLYYQLLWGIWFIGKQIDKVKANSRYANYSFANFAAALLFVALVLLSIYQGISDDSNSLQNVRDLRVGSTWLRDNSPSDSLIMAAQPQSIYLYSGRSTTNFANVSNVSELEQALAEQDIEYILIAPELKWQPGGILEYDQFTLKTLLPMLKQQVEEGKQELVYQSEEDKVLVFKVKK